MDKKRRALLKHFAKSFQNSIKITPNKEDASDIDWLIRNGFFEKDAFTVYFDGHGPWLCDVKKGMDPLTEKGYLEISTVEGFKRLINLFSFLK